MGEDYVADPSPRPRAPRTAPTPGPHARPGAASSRSGGAGPRAVSAATPSSSPETRGRSIPAPSAASPDRPECARHERVAQGPARPRVPRRTGASRWRPRARRGPRARWAVALHEADATRGSLPRTDDASFVDALSGCAARRHRAGRADAGRRAARARGTARPPRRGRHRRCWSRRPMPSRPAATRPASRRRSARVGIDTPRIHEPGDDSLPAFVKPRIGARAAGARRSPDAGGASRRDRCDPRGRRRARRPGVSSKARSTRSTSSSISMAGRSRASLASASQVVDGESIVSRTVRDAALSDAAIRCCRGLGLVGHNTIQAFRLAERVVIIEANPRYGGAANLGFEAGAPTPSTRSGWRGVRRSSRASTATRSGS